ncbi:hypothetical protein AB1285_17905 [Microbacterium sp. NRRL B-14842]|uniref:hypothetical protein n=1 Tax=Microbacterium sp. NRRL B-14842 TaxID=3162881 RepID=UPI003D2D350F
MTGPARRHDAAATPDPSRMHPDVAGNWALWSRIVGPVGADPSAVWRSASPS